MTAQESEKLAVMEVQMDNTTDTVCEIKTTLNDFIKEYRVNHKSLEKKFAPMDLKREVIQFMQDHKALEHQVGYLPTSLKEHFSHKWVERAVIGMLSISVTSIIAILINLYAS